MTKALEIFECVLHEILIDNIKTVIDESRTEILKEKVYERFAEYAKDMGFEVKSCIANTITK